MGNIFSGSEIVELGIQIEKNGFDFYQSLSKNTKNMAAEEVFKFLAGEEQKHITVFQGILSGVQKYEPQGLDADEYYAYMNDLASNYIFTKKDKGEELAKGIKGDAQAVDMGIGFEKDSIIFYERMKKIVPDFDQKVIDSLIEQENKHLKQLIELKTKI